MPHHKRITNAFSQGGIERVLIIDDAYDGPVIDEGVGARLLAFLRDASKRMLLEELGLDPAVIAAAQRALEDGEYDDEQLVKVRDTLFGAYVDGQEARFDPGEAFSRSKGSALETLKPLRALLKQSGGQLKVQLTGLENARTTFDSLSPQVVFLDFFLSADATEEGTADDAAHVAARKESVTLLRDLTARAPGTVPAIVLMSSKKDVGSEKDKFRREALPENNKPKIVSWRFQFLYKGNISMNGTTFEITSEAADALLDTSQSHRFGSELHMALEKWRTGVEKSVNDLIKDISELDVKDFAYLMRFRLADEGQPLSEYLHWLFGECLLEAINEKVDWSDEAFRKLDSNEGGIADSVEGAYDGATESIAKMFDRARIERRPRPAGASKRLGDIYRVGDTDKVRAIVTPDCDLVVRKKGPKVTRPLTIGGSLKRYDAPTTSLADFIMDGKHPHSVQWDRKDLEATNFDVLEGEENMCLTYLGTLRPLYAQELQRSVLNDLGRVGVSVAPVIGMTASATVHLRVKGVKGTTWQKLEVGSLERAWCTMMPPRGGKETTSRIIFYRDFVHQLLSALRQVPLEGLDDDDQPKLREAVKSKHEATFYKKLCIDGVLVGETKPCDIAIVVGTKVSTKKDAPWCQIVVDHLPEEHINEADDQTEPALAANNLVGEAKAADRSTAIV